MTRVIFIIKPCTTCYKGSTRFTNDRYGTRAPSSQINGQKPILVCSCCSCSCCPLHKSRYILQNKHLSISLWHSFFSSISFSVEFGNEDDGSIPVVPGKMSEVVGKYIYWFSALWTTHRAKQLSGDPSQVLFFCQKNANGLTRLTWALILH